MKNKSPQATIVSRAVHKWIQLPEAPQLSITQIHVPLRILLPKDCIAEFNMVPEGTEIRIRHTTKLPAAKKEQP